ncbi:MAG: chemotaxis protein CheW [Cellulosilyticaceae bacterium]
MENEYSKGRQFVIFKLDVQLYGIDIQDVQIIERIKSIMRVPKTPKWIKGVMNLRGEIIPVVDLRIQFNLASKESDEDTRIIIVKTDDNMVGIIVDSVEEVIELEENEIEQVQNVQGKMNMNHILGVAKIQKDNEIITVLNLTNIIEDAFEN